jgi:hypothetical protein
MIVDIVDKYRTDDNNPIKNLRLKDGLYHVQGELMVVHEVTLAAAVTNLKRLLVACGNRRVFIITPDHQKLFFKKEIFDSLKWLKACFDAFSHTSRPPESRP